MVSTSGKKIAKRTQFIDAAIVSCQLFTPDNFPLLEEALKKWRAGDEPTARILYDQACVKANVNQRIAPILWDTIKKTNNDITDDPLAWLTA